MCAKMSVCVNDVKAWRMGVRVGVVSVRIWDGWRGRKGVRVGRPDSKNILCWFGWLVRWVG